MGDDSWVNEWLRFERTEQQIWLRICAVGVVGFCVSLIDHWVWVGCAAVLAVIELAGYRVSRNGNTPLHLVEVLVGVEPNREIDPGRALKALTWAARLIALATAWWWASWTGVGFMALFLWVCRRIAASAWRWPAQEAQADRAESLDAYARWITELRATRRSPTSPTDGPANGAGNLEGTLPGGYSEQWQGEGLGDGSAPVSKKVPRVGPLLWVAVLLVVIVWSAGWAAGFIFGGVLGALWAVMLIWARFEQRGEW